MSAGALTTILSALIVARTTLYGLVGPWHFARMFVTPTTSNTARIAPPRDDARAVRCAAACNTIVEPCLPVDRHGCSVPFLRPHLDHLAPRLLHRLLHGDRHFLRLALAHADAAVAVADDGERREAEDPAALHHLGDAVDRDHLLAQAVAAVILLLRLARIGTLLCHVIESSELEAALAGRVGQRLHAAVKPEAGAIERNRFDAERLRAFRRCACRRSPRPPCCRRSSRPCARRLRASMRSQAPCRRWAR